MGHIGPSASPAPRARCASIALRTFPSLSADLPPSRPHQGEKSGLGRRSPTPFVEPRFRLPDNLVRCKNPGLALAATVRGRGGRLMPHDDGIFRSGRGSNGHEGGDRPEYATVSGSGTAAGKGGNIGTGSTYRRWVVLMVALVP